MFAQYKEHLRTLQAHFYMCT